MIQCGVVTYLELSLGAPGAKFRCASFKFSPIWTNIGARRRFGPISDDKFSVFFIKIDLNGLAVKDYGLKLWESGARRPRMPMKTPI